MPTIRLIAEEYPNPPAMDTAVSHALLQAVSAGRAPEILRLHRPGQIVAFGPKDHLSPGYARAVAAARRRGFASIQRLAGGRAAVFHRQTIAFSWIRPDPSPRLRITARFEELAAIMAGAFRSVGVDARVGEVPGEYCPGAHSVNARGVTKLMGVGQRLVHRAAHVGGVVVVGDAGRVRDVLIPVYRALGRSWDPATAGSLQDEVPGLTWEEARAAIVDQFARVFRLEEGTMADGVLEEAKALLPRHEIDLSGADPVETNR